MEREALDLLIGKYLDGVCTTEENAMLLNEIQGSDDSRMRLARTLYHEKSIADALQTTPTGTKEINQVTSDNSLQTQKRQRFWPYVAAAGILVVIGLFFGFVQKVLQDEAIAEIEDATCTSSSSKPTIVRGDQIVPVVVPQKIYIGDQVASGNCRLRVKYLHTLTALTASPGTNLQFDTNRLHINIGEVIVKLGISANNKPTSIQTPTAGVESTDAVLKIFTDRSETRADSDGRDGTVP